MRGDWYVGRPVMVTRNDYPTGTFNGDIGLALPDPARPGSLRVWFLEGDKVRSVLATRLRHVETAYAIEDRAGVALMPVVVNGCMPVLDGFSADPEAARRTIDRIDAVSGDVAVALADAESFRAGVQERQAAQCTRLAERLPLPQLRLPYLFTSELRAPELEVLARDLAQGIAALDEGMVP